MIDDYNDEAPDYLQVEGSLNAQQGTLPSNATFSLVVTLGGPYGHRPEAGIIRQSVYRALKMVEGASAAL